jgi:serine protease Do
VGENSPAARAGIRPGDVIVEFNGRKVENDRGLVDMVVGAKPGSTIPVRVVRDKQAKTMNVTIGELDLDIEADAQTDEGGDIAQGFGLSLEDLTPALARRLQLPAGTSGALVVEVRPRGPAAQAGLQEQDVLIRVGNVEVDGEEAAVRELQRVPSGRVIGVYVMRRGQEIFATMRKE